MFLILPMDCSSRTMKLNHYRIIKWLIPLSIIVYISMLYLHHNSIVSSDKLEIYPFAGWRLFSYTPERFGIESAVTLKSINEQPTDINYLIPNNTITSIDDQSVAKRTASACAVRADCSEAEELLFPIIKRLVTERVDQNMEDIRDIEFDLVKVRIDYSDVLDQIRDLADGTVLKSDFYKPVQHIGRWSTHNGRIMDASLAQGEDSQYLDSSEQASIKINNDVTFPQNSKVLVSESYFDIYLDDHDIIYGRTSCTQTDIDTTFFLHIIPYYLKDLPENRRKNGFDNLDFNFQNNYVNQSEKYDCITVQKLPEYRISGIRTGQFTNETGEVWRTQFIVAR